MVERTQAMVLFTKIHLTIENVINIYYYTSCETERSIYKIAST